MNQEEQNKFTLKEITDALGACVERSNAKMVDSFTSKLINFAIILCIIPFCIKLACELRSVEIISLLVTVGLGYMFFYLAKLYMLREDKHE